MEYRGLPGENAIGPTIIKDLQYEMSHGSCQPLVHTDNDAASCYDKITFALASLASDAHGQNKSITIINAITLQKAKFIVVLKTQPGTSYQHYTHSKIHLQCGIGQGAGNSPTVWATTSSTLFLLYEDDAQHAPYHSLDNTIKIWIYMVGFINDTSGSTNNFLQSTLQDEQHYLTQANKDAQRWNDILQLSGGPLQPSKYSYHFLFYKFSNTGIPYLSGNTNNPLIHIQFQQHSSPTPLKQLSNYESHKTLGVDKSPTPQCPANNSSAK